MSLARMLQHKRQLKDYQKITHHWILHHRSSSMSELLITIFFLFFLVRIAATLILEGKKNK